MTENALTFSELRKIQKEEKRQEGLTDLEDDFILRVSQYLESKKESSGEGREYRNAERVFNKIISLREQKIVKNAKITVKTDKSVGEGKLLPRETELFRQLKEVFKDHRTRIEKMVKSETSMAQTGTEEVKPEKTETVEEETEEAEAEEEPEEIEDPEPEAEEEEESEKEAQEGYEIVKILAEVPEFMGTDLETYGPFDEGEEVELPEDNAEILINRGNAEQA